MQPPEADRHVGQASPETDQIPPPADEGPEEDGRPVDTGQSQQHGKNIINM